MHIAIRFGAYLLFAIFSLSAIKVFAITFEIEGDVAADKKRITIEATISKIDPEDLKANVSIIDYKQNLRVYLPALDSSAPLRMTLGSDKKTDYVNDLYWDLTNSSVTILDQEVNSVDLKYTFTIYENTNYLNYTLISEILDSSSPAELTVKIGFKPFGDDLNDIKESEEEKISVNYAVVNTQPILSSVSSINKGIRISWVNETSVSFSDGKTRDSPKLLVTVFKFDDQSDIDLSAASFVAETGSGDDTNTGTCTLDADLVNSENSCISNCSNSLTDLVYLDSTSMKTLKNNRTLIYSELVENNPSSYDIFPLEVGSTYGAFIQYNRGTNRSTCQTTVVRENISLTEFNGEEDASLKGPACYIATATFGSSLQQKIDTFRWFRNQYLLTNKFGRKIVSAYYELSPPLAKKIKQSDTLKTVSLAILYPIYLILEVMKQHGVTPMLYLMIGLTILTCGVIVPIVTKKKLLKSNI